MAPLPHVESSTPIGLAGLGVMGSGIARSLLRAGRPVHVHTRNPATLQAFRTAGASAAADPAALARACPVVILSLPDAPAVDAVLFGVQGLAAALQPGSCVIDTSTIAPADARAFAQRLEAQGAWFLDAPVSGGQQGAEAGTLACMVGGPAAVVEACRDVLAAFCQSVTRAGEAGAGQAVKACNQVAVANAVLGVAEAMALARAEGVDPQLARNVLLAGTARSVALERHGLRILADDVLPAGFRARLMRKDLRIALAAAAAHGGTLAGAAEVERLLDALCQGGDADLDWTAVARAVARHAGA